MRIGIEIADEGVDSPSMDTPDREPWLEAIVRRGRAAWPEIAVEPAELEAYLLSRAPSNRAGRADANEPPAGDLYLAFACGRGNRAALAAFEKEHLREVGAFIAHIDRTPVFADEVRQALRASLLAADRDGREPGIATYRGRGPLGGFVRVAAVRTALNLKRQARRTSVREDASKDAASTVVALSPELAYAREQYRDAFGEALRAAVAELSGRDRTLLRLYHAEGVALEALAALYRVHLSTVSRWLTCAREHIAETTLRRLRERLRVGSSDAESIAALLMSQLDVSLVRLFRDVDRTG